MKRILASLMAVAVTLGLVPITAYALETSKGKINGMAQSLSVGYSSGEVGDAINLGEINPNEKPDATVGDGLGGYVRETEGFTPVETGSADFSMSDNPDTGGDDSGDGNDNPDTGRP